MKRKALLVALAACSFFAVSYGQEQASKQEFLMIHEDPVIPSMVEQYEKAAKNLAELVRKDGASITYTAVTKSDFTYMYFSPVQNLSDVDKNETLWDEMIKRVGADKFGAAMSQFNGCYLSHRNYMVRMRPELSYNPDFGKISEDMLFRHWDFYYLQPGMEDQADQIAKEWVALSKKVGAPEGYRLYSSAFGSDGPMFVVVGSGKNAADFYTRQEAWMKKAGTEGQALFAKTWKVIRKFESFDGGVRPDLSVMPKAASKK